MQEFCEMFSISSSLEVNDYFQRTKNGSKLFTFRTEMLIISSEPGESLCCWDFRLPRLPERFYHSATGRYSPCSETGIQ